MAHGSGPADTPSTQPGGAAAANYVMDVAAMGVAAVGVAAVGVAATDVAAGASEVPAPAKLVAKGEN